MKSFIELKKQESYQYGDSSYLENYLFENGRGFPFSYRDYANTLGYGRLCKLFIIYIPMESHPDSWIIQTKYIKTTILYSVEKGLIEYEPDGNPELINRCVPFAMSENGQYLFWDINNFVDNEFPIYVIGSEMGAVRYGASSLYDFAENCADPEKVKQMLGSGYKPLPLHFEPLKPY